MNKALEKAKSIIKFSRVKGIIGCVLALAVFLICAIFYSWLVGILFAAAFILVGCVQIAIKEKKNQILVNALYALFCIIYIFYVTCKIMFMKGFFISLPIFKFGLNVILTAVVCGLLYVITAKPRISICISAVLLSVLTLVNFFVLDFRGNEFSPTDFLATGAATNVMSQYDISIGYYQGYFLISLALVLFAQFSLPSWKKFPPVRSRVIVAMASVIMVAVVSLCSVNIPLKVWGAEGSIYNGYYLNFFLGVQTARIDKPDGYSVKSVEKLTNKYALTEAREDSPNIIVIMSESFADFDIFGEPINTNIPLTPYIDSLKENTIKGNALTSVYGGKTANSEFEFLTGHSMGFLPTASIPYQQYINKPIGSLVWQMRQLGYSTYATHPFFSSGWNRTTAFPCLGFQEATFAESYPKAHFIRNFVSDREMYEYVLNALDEQGDGVPSFVFGITMQNHGGYEYDGPVFDKTVYLEGYKGNYPQAEQYLSLINETDKATEYFLTELEQYPEDTVVLFFGDHFPKLENEFYEELAGGPLDTLEEQMKQHTVPFFIWANYDIPEAEVELTSLNFLSRYLLDAARIDLPPYYQFLAEVEQEIPAINVFGYYSKSQKKFQSFDKATGKEKEWLDKYATIQYNNIFDTKNRNENFFAKYISENPQ